MVATAESLCKLPFLRGRVVIVRLFYGILYIVVIELPNSDGMIHAARNYGFTGKRKVGAQNFIAMTVCATCNGKKCEKDGHTRRL